MASIDIVCEHDGWQGEPGLDAVIERAALAALAGGGVAVGREAELAVLLTGDGEIARLNRQWRGKDSPTNVLSFPACEPAKLAQSPVIGDIALALETCRREADDENRRFADHVAHLTVHGTLHLLGYDHESDEDAEIMEALERQILAGLDIEDPYADTRPGTAA